MTNKQTGVPKAAQSIDLPEVKRIIRAADILGHDHVALFACIAFGTGARYEEIAKTTFRDFITVDKSGKADLRKVWTFKTVKRVKLRNTVLPEFLSLRMLEGFEKSGSNLDNFVVASKKKPHERLSRRTFYDQLHKVVDYAGIGKDNITCHSFRKAFGRHMCANGGFASLHEALFFLMMEFRHSTVQMTAFYCGIEFDLMNAKKDQAFSSLVNF